MFDDIIVKKKLPLTKELKSLPIEWNKIVWQTKDLENLLNAYVIEKNGNLYLKQVNGFWRDLPEEEQDIWYNSEFVETDKELIHLKEYHGVLKFYTYETVEDEGWWVEFEAYYSYGKLDKIVLKEVKKDTGVLLRNEQIQKAIKEHQNHPWTKIKSLLSYLGWRWFWLKACKFLTCIENFLQFLRNKIHRIFL